MHSGTLKRLPAGTASYATPVRSAPARGRAVTDALVLDANLRQALVAIRSLGRSGLTVGAAESIDECDVRCRVPAFTSRWSAWQATLPSLSCSPGDYGRALLDRLDEHPTRVVIPSSDPSISALRTWRACVEASGAIVALAPETALLVANDKQRTAAIADGLGMLTPRSVPVISGMCDLRAVEELGYPVVIKPSESWIRVGPRWARTRPVEALDAKETLECLEHISRIGASAVVQEYIGGVRETVSLFYSDGRVWAAFAQVANRMTPVLGGVSVVRESIPMPSDLRTLAESLVREIGLEGVSEIEFRRDVRGRPVLMEINARLSGAVEVAVRSGVDLPRLVWLWAAGERLVPVTGYRTGVRVRHLQGDVKWVIENATRRGRPDSVTPSQAVKTFVTDFLRPQAYDYVDLSDLRPAWTALRRDARAAGRRAERWLVGSTSEGATSKGVTG